MVTDRPSERAELIAMRTAVRLVTFLDSDSLRTVVTIHDNEQFARMMGDFLTPLFGRMDHAAGAIDLGTQLAPLVAHLVMDLTGCGKAGCGGPCKDCRAKRKEFVDRYVARLIELTKQQQA